MKTQTKKAAMYQQIEKHGNNLNAIFNTGIEPVKLCKSLLRLERKANFATTCLCNTNTLHLLELNKYTGYDVPESTDEEIEKFFNDILTKVKKILFARSYNVLREKAIFINYDARGYALKIKGNYIKEHNLTIHQDWGGDGIIAPDFSN